MSWRIEKRKQGMEIWVEGQREATFIGECYRAKERKRTHYLAAIIVKALKENDDEKIKDLR